MSVGAAHGSFVSSEKYACIDYTRGVKETRIRDIYYTRPKLADSKYARVQKIAGKKNHRDRREKRFSSNYSPARLFKMCRTVRRIIYTINIRARISPRQTTSFSGRES